MANKKRLIDANELEKHFWQRGHDGEFRTLMDAELAIINAPTVDAMEVVHGRWKDNHCTVCGMMPMGDELWDQCDFAPPKFEMFMDYCPNCGAKMDGDGNEQTRSN